MYKLLSISLPKTAMAFLCFMALGITSSFAQVSLPPSNDDNFVLSKNEDFSTNDRIFDREDVLYMKIEAPAIDFTGLALNEFTLTPDTELATDANESIKGSFENLFDGSYVARVELNEIASSSIRWQWHALLEDDKGNQIEAEAEFFVGDPNADGIELEISGVLEEVGEGFILFYGRKILVTENTEIVSENGDALRLAELKVGDVVSVLLLISGEGEDLALTALHIIKEEIDRKEEIEVTGPITEIADRLFVVQDLVFAVTEDTKILGVNEEVIGFDELEENVVVNVIGQYQDDGTLIAILILVEDEDRGEFSLNGIIEVIEDDAVIVQGTLFMLSDNTIILSAEGDVVRLDYLEVGQFVEVRAQLGNNGLPEAITIKVEENANGVIFAKGVIEQLFDAGILVQGRKFLVTDNTGIVDENGHPISFSGLTVGLEVSVLGQYISETEMEAVLITLGGGVSEEIEVEGPITRLDDTGLVVQDLFFSVTEATVIFSNDGQQLRFGDLGLGVFVSVVGKRSDEGTLYATQINVETREIVIDGQIQRIDDDVFYVGDFKFLVTDKTEVLGEDGLPARFESLHVGALVIVEAEAIVFTDVNDSNNIANESYVATRIILIDDVREKITVAGPILEVGDERFVVGDYTFVVGDHDTLVKDENGQEIDYGRLEPGMVVEVEAVVTADGLLLAVCIQVKLDRPIRISGKIESIEGEVVVVGRVAFIVTDDTEIKSISGEALRLSDLRVGMLARVAVEETAAGRLVATHMRVLPRIEDEVTVTGVVEAVHDHSLVILGRTFFVTPNTVILNEDDGEMRLEGIESGRTVTVRADLLAGDGLVALKIKQLDEQVKDIQVTGPVEAVESNTVAVIGIYFFVDDATEVFGAEGEAIRPESLEIGETVELFATGQPDGTRLANLIRVQDVVVASGNIASLTDAEINLLGASFTVDTEALVLDAVNDHLVRGDLKAGQYVEIRGISNNQAGKNGAPSVVTKIKVLNESVGSVSIEETEEPAVPQGFELHQNYPNPFNPVTTISFALEQVGQVNLTVYTLLGQEVTRLIDGNFTPGTHQVQWNGRDHAGQSVASGVYLYKLQVGAEVRTRRMILLK